jgi:splicing factor U2AF subunit
MGQPKVDLPPMLAAQQAAMQLLAGGYSGAGVPDATCIVVLDNVVSVDELRDDAEFAEIEEDMREECSKYGEVVALRIPRPAGDADAPPVAGLGRVYVRYERLEQAARARASLHGRKFGGNAVIAAFYDESRFEAGEL